MTEWTQVSSCSLELRGNEVAIAQLKYIDNLLVPIRYFNKQHKVLDLIFHGRRKYK